MSPRRSTDRDGTTPQYLLHHGIYRAIASPLRAEPLRVSSLVQLIKRIGEPSGPKREPNEALRHQQARPHCQTRRLLRSRSTARAAARQAMAMAGCAIHAPTV